MSGWKREVFSPGWTSRLHAFLTFHAASQSIQHCYKDQMRQAMLDCTDLGYVNGHAKSPPSFLILYDDFWEDGESGLDYWQKGGLSTLPLKNLIQALLGQAELGDHSRAFVGISSSLKDKAKDSVFQLQGEASGVLGSKSLACKR